MSRCRSCGAPVEWAETLGGKAIPLDLEERPDGNLRVVEVTRRGAPIVAYLSKEALGHPAAGRRVTHFATCPNAASHRKADR